ncbi:MAG: hypothetical protein CM15mV103_050 [uncultured marine virus]|nr:MAG: hypothetical protein CM15mV103_050 [uncultured marine virus]
MLHPGPDTGVAVVVTGNQLTITIGSVSVIADAVTEDATPNPLTLGLGTLSITGQANVSVTANPLTLGIGTVTVTADATASPTANALTLATGNVTVTGGTGKPKLSSLTVRNTKEPGIITWNEIIPGANMVLDTYRSELKLWHQHFHQI